MSWIPPPAKRDVSAGRPWLPPSLRAAGFATADVARLSYIVVDELIGDSAGLSVTPWPVADDAGRLRFDIGSGAQEVAVSRAELCEFLGPPFAPEPGEASPARSLRIGNVFAAVLKSEKPAARWSPLGKWVGQTYDITRDARKVAKLAFYGAVTTTLTNDEAAAWRLAELRE